MERIKLAKKAKKFSKVYKKARELKREKGLKRVIIGNMLNLQCILNQSKTTV